MATTVIDVCNLALNHLGLGTIASLAETSKSALKCSAFFNMARDAVLRAHEWNFAEKEEALALISDETLTGWEYLYVVPAKCLKIRSVFTEDTLEIPEPQPFKIGLSPVTAVKAIATDLEDAYIKYTRQVDDPSLWDPLFVMALSFYLAWLLAAPLCGDPAKGESVRLKYALTLNDATCVNAGEKAVDNQEPSDGYLSSR
jgi:hypothetical protein